MDKYVRVDWPESQEWMGMDEFPDWLDDGDVVFADNAATLLIDEELYNRLTAVEEPTIPDEYDPIWDEYEGMPEESKPWFMKNE